MRKLSLLLVGTVLGAGLMLGVNNGAKMLSGTALAASPETYRQLMLFGDVLDRIRTDYVEQPDEDKLIEAAINGMLSSLDPHSSYLNPKGYKDMQLSTHGEFGGLGIEVTMEDNVLKVVTPIDDTPAARAGVRSGDIITQLDGESVQGLTLNQAVDKMRGPVNSEIKLTVKREGVADPIDIKITRATIQINPVKWHAEGEIGYLKIAQFNEHTYDRLKDAIQKADAEIGPDKIKGWVLDLRNNPGGLLDQAIQVSNAFLERGEIVSTRGRNADESQRYNARPGGDLTAGKPVIVLVNGGSASASEIVAGALQDHRRATILGTRSFGKGSVQTIIPIGPAGGALRLTTARYYTPSGRSIQAQGITPDIEVLQDPPPELKGKDSTTGEASLKGHLKNPNDATPADEKTGSQAYVPPDQKDDKALAYALDLLRGVKINAAFPANPKTAIPN
ncbi:MAG: S41 family peptidase [Ancalomicrobiaceae bacterium]|nr:S41 family peptidase [Ancalomicrobiaceae bacterium]